MKYAQFQSLYGRSDPRAVMVFQQGYTEVLPHIVVMAEELSTPMHIFDAEMAKSEGGFLKMFQECFDAGEWLVIRDVSAVEYVEWRQVGIRLAAVLPDPRYRIRGSFRLFAFILNNATFSHIVPPLVNQFAIVCDGLGNPNARSTLSPIFSGGVNVAGGGEFMALTPLGGDDDNRDRREHDRVNPYESFHISRTRALTVDTARTAALDPDYIDETLVSLREALQEKQSVQKQKMYDTIEMRIEEAMVEDSTPQDVDPGQFDKDDPKVHKDPRIVREKITNEIENEFKEHYDWLYPNILEWVVEQCPEADLTALPNIPRSDIVVQDIVWQTPEETCSSGFWGGSEVLVKEIRSSYIQEVTHTAKTAFMNEAARHFRLRHPQVTTLYGMSDNRMIIEHGPGTLEQALIRARYTAERWTVRKYLRLARHVLLGLEHLATQVVHRDIACRSIVEVSDDNFKVGQFSCAIPLSHSPSEAKSGKIPVRWTAPEGFTGDFTPMSDMWSFGVMMWEAFQYVTELPYGEEKFAANAILANKGLDMPVECNPRLYDLLVAPCLKAEPQARAEASTLLLNVGNALAHWLPEELDRQVPFPTDGLSFEEWNAKREQEKAALR